MELTIDNYSFGKMTIKGEEFTSDLIINHDGSIEDKWWRAEGHNLIPEDIGSVLDYKPDKLIIGTGAFGLMKVSEELRALCKEKGIEIDASRTGSAVKRFNEAAKEDKSIAACFHLTC